jgi:hypothetical protein
VPYAKEFFQERFFEDHHTRHREIPYRDAGPGKISLIRTIYFMPEQI